MYRCTKLFIGHSSDINNSSSLVGELIEGDIFVPKI
uniref:Glycosyltransferase family 1 protein n=1 Tax=Ascaris lumbricoides TaxID=6252 RepID=A0A0M3IAX8_ASCLU